MDEIHPAMLKALDIVRPSSLARLYSVVWRSGTEPAAWQTGVVVPIFKKGTGGCHSNYRGVTSLSLPGRVYSALVERRLQLFVQMQRRRSVVFALAVEWWSSSLPFHGCRG